MSQNLERIVISTEVETPSVVINSVFKLLESQERDEQICEALKKVPLNELGLSKELLCYLRRDGIKNGALLIDALRENHKGRFPAFIQNLGSGKLKQVIKALVEKGLPPRLLSSDYDRYLPSL